MALLNKLISDVRLEIADKDRSFWDTDDEIIRAIEKTVSLMSRLLPRKGVVTEELEESWIEGNYVDISELLPADGRLGDAIHRVEYPVGRTPPELIPVEVMGNYLWLKTNVPIRAGESIRIIYQGTWTPPTIAAPGNYPPHLDSVVVIGAAGQALIFKAEHYTNLSAVTVEKALKTLDELIEIEFPDAPDPETGDLSYFIGKAKDTLVKAQSAFGTALATLGGMSSYLSSGADRIGLLPSAVSAARGHMSTGAPLINKVTIGDKVGETYGAYAINEISIARESVQSGVAYAQLAGAVEAKAGRESIIANGYIQEAVQHLAAIKHHLSIFESEVSLNRNKVEMYRAQLESMSRENNIPSQYLAIAGRCLASGQAKINEFLAALGYKPELHKSSSASEQR